MRNTSKKLALAATVFAASSSVANAATTAPYHEQSGVSASSELQYEFEQAQGASVDREAVMILGVAFIGFVMLRRKNPDISGDLQP